MNFAVASRPHYDLATQMSTEIHELLKERQILDPSALENQPAGLIYIDEGLSVDLSSTDLRNRLKTPARSQIESEQIPTHTLEIITNLGLYL
jgi:nicotinate-nucleotide adenylyltransferase